MSCARWLWNWTIGSTVRRLPRARQRCRRRLELLEDRFVLAGGWVNWQEGWPGIETFNPTSPTTSDVINFAFLDHQGDPADTYLDLSFDLTNKAIDILFLPLPEPAGSGGYVITGVYGQLDGLDPGVWTLRSLESSVTFTVSLGPPSPPSTFPLMTISDAGVTEGDAGAVISNFTVSLSTPSDQPVTVNYATATANGSTVAGGDYQPVSGTLIFNPGETSQTIAVPVLGDTLDEFVEIFNVNLRSPINATLVGGQATGIIWDDDPPPALAINDVASAEGDSGGVNFVFTVSLSAASSKTVNVNFATSDATAMTSNNDYVLRANQLTFAPGETTKTITVQVTGDTRDEFDETFVVNLSTDNLYAEYVSIADGQGVGTILDDDPPPALSINDVSMAEGHSGIRYFVFTVSLSAVTDKAVSVNFATANATATTANNDYVAASGTLTFAPGETTKTITVQVKGDRKKEANETFFLNLFGAVDAVFTDSQGRGVILNDD